MKKRRKGWELLLCVLLTGAATAGLMLWNGRAEAPRQVEIARVSVGRVEQRIAAAAQVRGEEEYAALCPATGLVEQVYVRSGDRVSAGQPLFRLNAEAQENALSAALSTAGDAPAQLVQQVSTALSVPEGAWTGAAQQQRASELAALRQALEVMTVRAPTEGVVQQVLVAEHGGAMAGSAAVTLTSHREVVRCLLVPRDAEQVTEGMEARVLLDGEEIGRAQVKEIAPATADADTGMTVQAVTLMPTKPLEVPVGAKVDVEIILQSHEGALVVPLSALTPSGTVWWLAEGRAWETPVDVSMRDAESAWVNLPAGTPVVLDPAGLTEGERVEVLE